MGTAGMSSARASAEPKAAKGVGLFPFGREILSGAGGARPRREVELQDDLGEQAGRDLPRSSDPGGGVAGVGQDRGGQLGRGDDANGPGGQVDLYRRPGQPFGEGLGDGLHAMAAGHVGHGKGDGLDGRVGPGFGLRGGGIAHGEILSGTASNRPEGA